MNINIYVCVCVALMVGISMMLMVAQGAPTKSGAKGHGRKGTTAENQKPDHPRVSLLLDSKFLNSGPARRPINNSSLSPWVYSITEDDSRFPRTIMEARCLYSGCLNSKGQETLDLQSKPILTEVLILRRVTGVGDTYYFRLESKTISVGCTCVRHQVEYQ
uniref:Uncharacterized protein n=1 Tax=Denticeps clupeoides TaxID=299321 RepID=A0AAY4A501_9TELE